jgi:hypothetical protein
VPQKGDVPDQDDTTSKISGTEFELKPRFLQSPQPLHLSVMPLQCAEKTHSLLESDSYQ